jgi:hypothetical protein
MVHTRGGPAADFQKSAAGRRAFRHFRFSVHPTSPAIQLAPDESQEIGKDQKNWE